MPTPTQQCAAHVWVRAVYGFSVVRPHQRLGKPYWRLPFHVLSIELRIDYRASTLTDAGCSCFLVSGFNRS